MGRYNLTGGSCGSFRQERAREGRTRSKLREKERERGGRRGRERRYLVRRSMRTPSVIFAWLTMIIILRRRFVAIILEDPFLTCPCSISHLIVYGVTNVKKKRNERRICSAAHITRARARTHTYKHTRAYIYTISTCALSRAHCIITSIIISREEKKPAKDLL